MTTLVARNSRTRYILFLILALAFVAGGIVLVVHEKGGTDWGAWAGIVFFGACALVFIRQLCDARPRLVIDAQGIFDRTLRVGVIPWDDIVGAYPKSIYGNDFICLELRDADPWLARLSPRVQKLVKTNLVLGFQVLNVNLSGTNVKPDAVLAAIRDGLAR